jgi:KipI family sensor histidine kinase inhibitor
MNGFCLDGSARFAIEFVSHDSLMLRWQDSPESRPEVHDLIVDLYREYRYDPRFIQCVPSYQSLLLQLADGFKTLVDADQFLEDMVGVVAEHKAPLFDQSECKTHIIPSYYDPEVAADLEALAKDKSLDIEAVSSAHCAREYKVYSLGFMPGFAYLGYVSKQLESPRHTVFSSQVPAGSVAIADRQTAVYPFESPGGWKIIGRTPIEFYKNQTALLEIGDRVQFEAVDRAGYVELGGKF